MLDDVWCAPGVIIYVLLDDDLLRFPTKVGILGWPNITTVICAIKFPQVILMSQKGFSTPICNMSHTFLNLKHDWTRQTKPKNLSIK